MMNETIPPIKHPVTTTSDFHDDCTSSNNDEYSVDHDQDMHFTHTGDTCGSTYTGTTRSLSDISGSKSSIVGDQRQRISGQSLKWPFTKSITSPKTLKTKGLDEQPDVRRNTIGKRKVGRKLFVGMIAKVMKGTIGDTNTVHHSENEIYGESDSTLIVDDSIHHFHSEGIHIGVPPPMTPPFCDDAILHGGEIKDVLSNPIPPTSALGMHGSHHSVIAEEVCFASRVSMRSHHGDSKQISSSIRDEDSVPTSNDMQTLSSQSPSISQQEGDKSDGSGTTDVVNFESHVPSTLLGGSTRTLPGQNKKSLIRASSESTVDEIKASKALHLPPPKRRASAHALYNNSDSNRDVLPRMPPRQRSFDKLLPIVCEGEKDGFDEALVPPGEDILGSSRRTLTSNSTRSSGTSNGTLLSGEQIQAYVMSHMPLFVQEQLPEEEWKRIFSAAAVASQKSPLAFAVALSCVDNEEVPTEKKVHDRRDEYSIDDDVSTEVSCLTSPSSVEEFKEEVDSDELGLEEKFSDAALPSNKTAALQSRTWHEGSSTHSSAPRLPTRSSQGQAASRMNNDISPSQNLVHEKCRFFEVPPRIRARPSSKVIFTKVYVRYYERILDINPCTSNGPSVGIGWNYKEIEPVDCDLVEDKATDYHDLILTRQMREKILYDLGYKRVDLAKAVRLNLKLKNQRAQTYNNLRHEKVEYLVEKSKRKVGRLLRSFGPGKKE